jgi:hypothetical protein
MAPPYALDNAILYGLENGVFMDSSWRNKNAHRAPMTVLATHDDYHRMVPSQSSSRKPIDHSLTVLVAVMISQHGNSRQYYRFLSKVSEAVQARATALKEGAKSAKHKETLDRLLENATVVMEDGWVPQFVMIDGCKSERKAIDRLWPGLAIRVCQFHLIQAVRSCCRSLYGRSIPGEQKTQATLDAFRQCQRCADVADWPREYRNLQERVNVIAGDDGAVWTRFDEYLRRSWFSDLWRTCCVDYGLPIGAMRDGAWATNNYVEAVFRVFDRVLLCGRANKR